MEIIKSFLRKILGPIYNPLKDLYYKLIYLLFKTFKSKKGVLIYIGINTGESFKRIYYKYKIVIGFEPNPENFKKLEKYNQIKDVFLYPYAVSDKNGVGIGLTLGICVAFIGLIFDNLIRTWVDKRKKHLGIA